MTEVNVVKTNKELSQQMILTYQAALEAGYRKREALASANATVLMLAKESDGEKATTREYLETTQQYLRMFNSMSNTVFNKILNATMVVKENIFGNDIVTAMEEEERLNGGNK